MVETKHNLDEGISESFTFKMGGHVYTCTYPTIHEIREAFPEETDLTDSKNEQAFFDFIANRISAEENSPSFIDAFNNILLPQRTRFIDMIVSEFGGM